ALVSGQQQVLDVGERLGKLRGDVDEAVGFHVFQDAVESSALVRVRAGGHGLTYLPSLTYREYVPRVCRAPRRGNGWRCDLALGTTAVPGNVLAIARQTLSDLRRCPRHG